MSHSSNRRDFLRRTVGTAGVPVLRQFADGATPGSQRPPNVIIILTDDQGYGDLSCHGNPVLKTPKMDQLFRESVRFTDFHAAPMCTPTRSQIMTGRDALYNGADCVCSGRSFIRPGIPTMAEIFAANGYRTGHFGKWHLGDNYPRRPQDRGFHETVHFPGYGITSAPDYWNNDYFDNYFRHNGTLKRYPGYCTDIWFSEAMKWIAACRDKNEPFFTYLPTNAPHWPVFVPDRYREPYRHLGLNVASFLGMIVNIDENLGKLDAMLKETGLRDNTILIFMTDNGGTFGVRVYNAGMRGGKQSLYDGGHRVPCFWRWPAGGLRSPGDIGVPAQCQDLLPTLIDLCGLRPPDGVHFDGSSLAAPLRGRKLPDRMLVVQYGRLPCDKIPEKWDSAVLWNQWRLVKGKELYDIKADAGQESDIAGQHPGIIKKMRAHYEEWWSRVEPKVADLSCISVGSDQENPTYLSCHDWLAPNTSDAKSVRLGVNRNGPWNVLVERAGQYEISLRRWPKEADAAITAGLPAFAGTDRVLQDTFPEGKALPVARARLKIGGVDESKMVGKDDKAVTFRVRLASGQTQLQTWFYERDGNELCGAYCTYVQRL